MESKKREEVIKDFEDLIDECGKIKGAHHPYITMKNAITLIKELTEENEKLNKEIRIRDEIIDYRGSEVLRHDRCIRTLHNEIAILKEDTVRKMQNRLKEELDKHYSMYFRVLGVELIDRIAKELSD